MPLVHYKKESLRNQILVNGKPVQWESIGNDQGVKTLNDENPSEQETIRILEDYANKRRMGVIRVSEAIVDSLKKNIQPRRVFQPLPPGVGAPIRVFNKDSVLPGQKQAVAPVAESGAGKVLQQATQNPDGTPGTPVNIAVPPISAKERLFKPRAKKASEVLKTTTPAPVEPPKA